MKRPKIHDRFPLHNVIRSNASPFTTGMVNRSGVRFKLRAFRALFLLATTAATMILFQEAFAHGAVGEPIARQYRCYLEKGYWWPTDGSGIPHTDCRGAYRRKHSNSYYPFTQWHEVSANPVGRGKDFDKLRQAVPNGLLCAGGDQKKVGLDLPAINWRKTTLNPVNGRIRLVWENTRSHNPSRMRVYISKASYNPRKSLRWQDLDLIYSATAPAPTPANGGGRLRGTIRSFYKLNVALPAGRTGDAVLYSYWQRDDSGNEGFFNCSDVHIPAR